MRNKILVMGATGKVGYEVIKYLSKYNVDVKAAIHTPQSASKLSNIKAETVLFDINNTETLKEAFSGVKKLFLLLPSIDTDTELAAAKKIIDFAEQEGVDNIVQLSAMGVEHYPTFSNFHIEKYLNDKSIPHIHLRPNFFMQNFNTIFLNPIKQKNSINFYDAGIPTSLIDTRDIGAVAAKLLLETHQKCATYTLTGSEALTHAQVAAILSKVTNKSIQYTAKSDDDTRATLFECGWTEEGIEKVLLLFQCVQRGVFAPVHTDVSDLLERAPISFQQYAEEYKDYFK